MYRNHSVAVVVPAYNEEGFVGDVIDTVPTFVDRVYAVDDRSTDGTWAEICARADGTPPEPARVDERRSPTTAEGPADAASDDAPQYSGSADGPPTPLREDAGAPQTDERDDDTGADDRHVDAGTDDRDAGTRTEEPQNDGTRTEERRTDDDRHDDTRTDGGSAGSAGTARPAPPVRATPAHEAGTNVVPIRHEHNRGVGAAITSGYTRALADGMDLVAVMAGDGQMDPDQLDALLDPLVDGRADYAKANRLRSAEHRAGMSRFRLFGNAILTLLTKVSSGYWELLDPQNGYTVATAEALETVDLEATYDGYGFANDLLARLNRHDLRVAHVDIPANYGDETSHINYGPFVRSVSLLLLSNFLWRLKHKYVLGSFHPLVLSYLVGATVSVVGTVALVGSLVGLAVGSNGGLAVLVSALLLAVGAHALVAAMREEANRHEGLEVQVT